MIDLRPASRAVILEDRLARGIEVLLDLERRGETGKEYRIWLRRWTELLEEYEALDVP